MAINLMALEPHKVSRDLSGYVTYIYGQAKTGKTTLASQSPGALILAFERGYAALPGVLAQDMGSWNDVKAVIRELKKPEVKERFKTIIFDTIDIAGDLCERYICAQRGVDTIGQLSYGQGYTLMKKEFDSTIHAITQLGYAIFFISHEKDKEFAKPNGIKYNQTVPTCPSTFNSIARDAADIYAYAQKYEDENHNAQVKLIIRSIDNSADTGCRFRYMKPEIPMSYESLVTALNEAIEAEAAMTGNKYITNEREAFATAVSYDFEGLMAKFSDMVNQLMALNPEYYAPRLTLIVEKVFGRGNKITDATLAQAELVSLVVDEVEEELFKKADFSNTNMTAEE